MDNSNNVIDINQNERGQVIDENTPITKNDIIKLKEDIEKILIQYKEFLDNSEGDKTVAKEVKNKEFNKFKNHVDQKFDRVFDKIDENRKELKDDFRQQSNKTISFLSLIVTLIGVIVPVILHFI